LTRISTRSPTWSPTMERSISFSAGSAKTVVSDHRLHLLDS
jgi:hypothetical protein